MSKISFVQIHIGDRESGFDLSRGMAVGDVNLAPAVYSHHKYPLKHRPDQYALVYEIDSTQSFEVTINADGSWSCESDRVMGHVSDDVLHLLYMPRHIMEALRNGRWMELGSS